MLVTALIVLVGSMVLSAVGVVRGWRMRRFRRAQRLARRLGGNGGIENPRGRWR